MEIVRNADDPLRRGELVQPARRVFGSEEEGPELFGGVGTTRMHPNGTLWIAESQSQEVRVFDPGSGAHLFTIGGRGDGPGEFRRSGFLGFDGEGSAYVYDYEHRRLSVFSGGGEFERSHLLPSTLGISPLPQHVTRTGTLLGQIPRGVERMPARGSTLRDTVRTWTMPLDGTAPTLVSRTLGALFYFHDGESVRVPFSGGSPRGFRDDRVYAIDGVGEASYSVYGPAGLERRVEVDRPPRRIDDRTVTMFIEGMRRSPVPESQLRIYEEHLSDMPIPEARRHWDGMLFTDQGEVWLWRTGDAVEATAAGDPADGYVWDVFDAEGVFTGHMRMPANIWLVQVIGQTALTNVRDEMGRATVAIHDIRWIG